MKHFIPLILIFFYLNTFSQIGLTPEEIIENMKTTDYKKEFMENEDGTTNYNNWKLIFTQEEESKASGKYTQLETYYIQKYEGGDILCYQYRYTEPLSEANAWIKYYEGQDWVKTEGELEWIDYGGKRKRNIYIDETCRVYIRYYKP